ncbi:MAG TPA: NnrS family protein [Steroidobacteraceae bacterium]|nr:NnrS family protein [Steroidobacteraceae bacterium]
MTSALWNYGFRPFFLAAGLSAALLIPWWAGAFAWGVALGSHWPPLLWHGHEMLFGFITAAIAGFLLTAVPSWTGARGFAGRPLQLVAAVWLFGRILIATSVLWPRSLVAGVDLIFLPSLAGLVLPPLARARNRNTPLLAVLTALWATNVAFYWGLFRGDGQLSLHALTVGIDIVLVLVTVIGGRIIPAFTSAAFKQRGIAGTIHTWRGVTPAAIGVMLILTIVDLWRPDTPGAGVIAAAAALIQAVRIAQWQGLRTVRMPIVWVLHLGYLWLPVGLALKALALLGGVSFAAFYLHALTIGAATTMIVAVMTRASLGHTGRALIVARPTVYAYGFLTAAVIARVFGPASLPLSYPAVIVLAAILWTVAFVLFLRVYAPILWSPRMDGKPG